MGSHPNTNGGSSHNLSMLIELILNNRGLGINLRAVLGKKGAFVDSFYQSPSGESLEAENSGQIDIGDILVSIGSCNVSEDTIELIQTRLSREVRPLTLIFQRSPPSSMTLQEVVTSPLNRIWVKKLLRENKFYLDDQVEWQRFTRCQEIMLVLEAISCDSPQFRSMTDEVYELASSFQIEMSKQHVTSTVLLQVLHECSQIMLNRGLSSVITAFLLSDHRKRMEAYYFRYLAFTHTRIPLLQVCTNATNRLFLYLFLARHRM